MSEPFLAEIKMFGGNFAPRGYALCNGQILPIAQNTALFSLLGTTFGGNGQTTFALPNLQSRVPLHPGQGAGLSSYSLGEQGGVESVTLITAQLPPHTHTVAVGASTADATTKNPSNAVPANTEAAAYTTPPDASLLANNSGATGSNQPHENRQPYLCVNFIIALEGIFPSRN